MPLDKELDFFIRINTTQTSHITKKVYVLSLSNINNIVVYQYAISVLIINMFCCYVKYTSQIVEKESIWIQCLYLFF